MQVTLLTLVPKLAVALLEEQGITTHLLSDLFPQKLARSHTAELNGWSEAELMCVLGIQILMDMAPADVGADRLAELLPLRPLRQAPDDVDEPPVRGGEHRARR